MCRSAFLAVALALAPLGAAVAEPVEKPTVAVLEFSAANAPAGEAAIISDFVRQAVIRSGKFRVVEKKNMDKILSEQAFQQTGCTTSECAVKLGKLLNTRKMVVGELSALAGVRYLTASLVDVETGEIERTARVKEFDARTIDVATDRLVSQLAEVDVSVSGDRVGPGRPDVPPARRGRTGVSLGLRTFNWSGYLDFKNSRPAGTVQGPYTNARIELESAWSGAVLQLGYRGPFKRGGRIGFAVGAEFAPGSSNLPVGSAPAVAPNGQPVRFETEHGGVDSLLMYGGAAAVTFNVLVPVNVWVGARVNAFRLSAAWNTYQGPGMPESSHFGDGDFPRLTRTVLYGELGAEYLFSEHVSAELALHLHTGRSSGALQTDPFELSFTHPSAIFNAALRAYF